MFGNRKKYIATAVAISIMAFSAGIDRDFVVSAAPRADIAKINVTPKGKFKYWTKDSAAKKELTEFVKDVTDEGSRNFIPKEERIAVFDCDGTFMCETGPYYFDWMLSLHRALRDKSYSPTDDMINDANEIDAAIRDKHVSAVVDAKMRDLSPKLMAGMTVEEYRDYVTAYMNTTGLDGFTNLKAGEAFYLPMAEVISYLTANDFKVYVVSGAEREALRTLLDGIIPIPPEQIIGSDHVYRALNQGKKEASKYFFTEDDKIVRGDTKVDVNLAANKVFKIWREIGRQPVLAFGNSMEDAGMLQYTLANNKNKSAAFVVLCDDTRREFGNVHTAAKMERAAKEYGWHTISMAKDFADIYGGKVRIITKHAGEK